LIAHEGPVSSPTGLPFMSTRTLPTRIMSLVARIVAVSWPSGVQCRSIVISTGGFGMSSVFISERLPQTLGTRNVCTWSSVVTRKTNAGYGARPPQRICRSSEGTGLPPFRGLNAIHSRVAPICMSHSTTTPSAGMASPQAAPFTTSFGLAMVSMTRSASCETPPCSITARRSATILGLVAIRRRSAAFRSGGR
jgi:hypothetical protein